MTEENGTDNIGYGKPPKQTQFAKGQSGNPKGRPKGSQNVRTIVAKAWRQRIRVTENGRTRTITKFEAGMLQLINKAAAGDLKAITELRYWTQSLPETDQTDAMRVAFSEADESVIANIKRRFLQPESTNETGPKPETPSQKGE